MGEATPAAWGKLKDELQALVSQTVVRVLNASDHNVREELNALTERVNVVEKAVVDNVVSELSSLQKDVVGFHDGVDKLQADFGELRRSLRQEMEETMDRLNRSVAPNTASRRGLLGIHNGHSGGRVASPEKLHHSSASDDGASEHTLVRVPSPLRRRRPPHAEDSDAHAEYTDACAHQQQMAAWSEQQRDRKRDVELAEMCAGIVKALNDQEQLLHNLREERSQVQKMLEDSKSNKLELVALMHGFHVNKELAVEELSHARRDLKDLHRDVGDALKDLGELRKEFVGTASQLMSDVELLDRIKVIKSMSRRKLGLLHDGSDIQCSSVCAPSKSLPSPLAVDQTVPPHGHPKMDMRAGMCNGERHASAAAMGQTNPGAATSPQGHMRICPPQQAVTRLPSSDAEGISHRSPGPKPRNLQCSVGNGTRSVPVAMGHTGSSFPPPAAPGAVSQPRQGRPAQREAPAHQQNGSAPPGASARYSLPATPPQAWPPKPDQAVQSGAGTVQVDAAQGSSQPHGAMSLSPHQRHRSEARGSIVGRAPPLAQTMPSVKASTTLF